MINAAYSRYILAIVSQTSIILHIPHSQPRIPPEVRSGILLNDADLRLELLRMTDWYTDELFDTGIGTAIVYPVSRLVADPERFVDDKEEPMSQKGMGVVYSRTSEGQMLRYLDPEERAALINTYYRPHHKRLERAVADNLYKSGQCLIIDCHSFSSLPLPHETDQNIPRPDICIDTESFHTPENLVRAIENACREKKLVSKRNSPFKGTLVPSAFHLKEERVRSIMIEVNRALYMDESTGRKVPWFINVRSQVRKILGALSL